VPPLQVEGEEFTEAARLGAVVREYQLGRGANWGFETFRFMVKKSDVKNRDFKFDPDSASNACDYFPDLAARELLTLGKKIFPDVPEWGENAMKPDENAHVSEPSSEFTPGTEDESSEGEDS
jgi:hypothetical protein